MHQEVNEGKRSEPRSSMVSQRSIWPRSHRTSPCWHQNTSPLPSWRVSSSPRVYCPLTPGDTSFRRTYVPVTCLVQQQQSQVHSGLGKQQQGGVSSVGRRWEKTSSVPSFGFPARPLTRHVRHQPLGPTPYMCRRTLHLSPGR